jgi:cytochrome c556
MGRRAKILSLSFGALLSMGGLLWAASPLRPIMRGWKSDLVELDRMITYNQSFNAQDAQRLLAGFATDSQSLSKRINGAAASAKDLRARFDAFAKQSSAMAALTGRDALEARYVNLRGACKECHDVYAN